MALWWLYSWIEIFFLAGTDVVELDSDGAMVVELDGSGAAVAASKPSRSMGSSQSTGVGEVIWCYLAAVGALGSPLLRIASDCDGPVLPAWCWPHGEHSLV